MPKGKKAKCSSNRSELSKVEFMSNARISMANQAGSSELFDAVPVASRQFTPKLQARASQNSTELDGQPQSDLCGPFHLRVAAPSELNEHQMDEIYKLLRTNMKPLYDQSNTPWNDEAKFSETKCEKTRFLIALTKRSEQSNTELSSKPTTELVTESTGGDNGSFNFSDAFGGEQVAAFAHIRFELEEQHLAVTYIYELQVSRLFQGRGVGTWLLDCAQAINKRFQLSRLLLTVFKFNADAIRFYEKAGFKHDETNLAPADDNRYDYVILSRIDRSELKPKSS